MPKIPGHTILTRFFDRVLPTAPDFFSMLSEQSMQVTNTVEKLVEFMQTDSAEAEAGIHDDEHKADVVKIANIRILNEAFATPIDREDIYRSITNLDEIVNYCKDTVNEMDALGVKPDRFMLEMSQFLLNGAVALRDGYQNLNHKPDYAAQDAELARHAVRNIDRIYRVALAELFHGDNYIQMFKKREIYRHLTNAAERMAHCASTLHDIVVKMV